MTNITLENLHLGEIKMIRVALDQITIQGQDAKFLAQLQVKLEKKIEEVEKPTKK